MTNNIWINFIILPLVLALILTFVFRSYIFRFEEWFDRKKKDYQRYKTDKILQNKTTEARIKEILDKKGDKNIE